MSRSAFAFFVALAAHAAVLPTVTASTCLSNVELSVAIVNAVQSLRFNETFDLLHNTTTHAVNNLDVSVIAFDDSNQCPPTFANVLLSRDLPYGWVSSFDPSQGTAGSVIGVDWRWWDYVRWEATTSNQWNAPAQGQWFGSIVPPSAGAQKFMSPHPASSFKVMVATGVMFAVERGVIDLMDDASINITAFTDGGSRFIWNGNLDSALHGMLLVSDNSATAACIAALHRGGMLPTKLMSLFQSLGLNTLNLNNTQPGGYWGGDYATRNRSSDFDTTGFFTMTSWDISRLLWLIDPRAPDPTWLVNGQRVDRTFLSLSSRQYIMDILAEQAFHDALSTPAICGQPFVQPGIPSFEPSLWVRNGKQVVIEGSVYSEDVTPCNAQATALFAHKTGLTNEFGSNVGVVTGFATANTTIPRHYIISVLGNIGERYTDADLAKISSDPCIQLNVCYTQRLPSLGKKIDDYISMLMG